MPLYSAPKSFRDRLKNLGPRLHLSARWSDKHSRWQIIQSIPDKQEKVIFTVNNDDGSFRPLDDRTLFKLKKIFRLVNINVWDEMDKENAYLELEQKRIFEEQVEAETLDKWRKIKNIPQFSLGGIN